MRKTSKYMRIMAIDPCQKGFGFAVLEGSGRLVDWGVARVWARSDNEFIARVEGLVRLYRPRLLVLEDMHARKGSGRRLRLISAVTSYGTMNRMRVQLVSWTSVRQRFENSGGTKFEIAKAITEAFPELRPHLPRIRKPWMSEDQRINIFDAVALALSCS